MDYRDYSNLLLNLNGEIDYVVDIEKYELLHMTRAAMDLYGLESPEEYGRVKCYELLHGKNAPCDFCAKGKLHDNESCHWTHYNEKLGKWMMLEDRIVSIDGRKCLVETACDITRSKRPSSRLSDTVTTETILLECIRTLSKADNLITAVSSFLETLGRFYRADRTYIIEFDKEKGLFSNTYEWCHAGATSIKGHLQNKPISMLDEWIRTYETKGEYTINAVDESAKETEVGRLMQEWDIHSMMTAPLILAGNISGLLGVDNPQANLENKALLRATADFVVEEMKKRRMLSQLEYTSYTDMLTGVYNRNCYIKELGELYKAPPSSLGVLMADVNGLKRINDLYGHQTGDEAIRKTAQIMKETLNADVYRVGGDEFAVLFKDIDRETFDARADELENAFAEESQLNVSLGRSWKAGSLNIDEQLFRADQSMYSEKQMFYNDLVNEEHLIESSAAAEVLRDIENDMFVVYYQPKLDLKTGKITGAEALVRKRGGEDELLLPAQFMPFYEAQGILSYVDIFVFDTAIRTLGDLRRFNSGMTMSVNLSRNTLMLPNFLEHIRSVCARYEVTPDSVTLEITENVARFRHESFHGLFSDIRNAGFRISLDDFGTGYSNLSILTDMDFDEVKFDRSLVDDIDRKPRGRIVLENLMQMCRSLQNGAQAAEGIETPEQANFLRQHMCGTGQGYFFHRPMPIEDFMKLLDNK